MNSNEIKLLKFINEELKNGKIEDAQFLLEKCFIDKRYLSFIEYMNKKNKTTYSSNYLNSIYGEVDGKQVFSDHFSVYEMNEPFSLDVFMNKNFDVDSKKLSKYLESVRKYMIYSEEVYIYRNISKSKPIDIITKNNEEFFHGSHIKTAFEILGRDVEFRLSDDKPILMAKNEKGKAYILGLGGTKPRNIEIRTFYGQNTSDL